MANYEDSYEEQTAIFSEAVQEADVEKASMMVAGLWNEREYFDHSIDDDFAVLLFAEKGKKEPLQQLLDLGADPSTYDNAAIKFAAKYGHKDIVLLLAKDLRVNPIEALDYVQPGPGRDALKLAIVEQVSLEGDDDGLQALLNDPEFRIEGVEDVLQPHHKKKYAKKLLREVSRAFKPVRQQIPLEIVAKITSHAYNLPALSLHEMMETMKI